MDALQAMLIDFTMDVTAIRIEGGFWDWGIPQYTEISSASYFGVLWGNYLGWFLIVLTFSYTIRLIFGSRSWKNVADRVPGLPKGTYVSRLVASGFAEGRVYAGFDGHRSDDYGVYVFVSEDFGESWSSLSSNVPHGHTVSVIREHPQLRWSGCGFQWHLPGVNLCA